MNKRHFFLILGFILLTSRPSFVQDHHGHEHHEHAVPDGKQESHEEHDHGHEESTVHVDKDMQRAIGLTFEEAQMRSYEERIKVYGEIAQDTDKYTHITSGHDGTVKKIYVQTGSIIDENEPILSITKSNGTIELISAPHHGTVIAIHVQAGDRVDHLRSLASLADLDKLRVSFDVYEKDLRFVSVGQTVHVYSTAYPDKVFKGKIVFVSTRIDKHTQTIKIRAEVDNYDHLLRLGMFVAGDLIFSMGGKVLSVSQMTVQQIEEETVVFIPDGNEFRPQEIQVGREFGNYIEVLSGLEKGQQVVSKGSFALKSELQKGAFGHGHAH